MLIKVIISSWIAGLVALAWMRVISATNFGRLSWPFVPVSSKSQRRYRQSVYFFIGALAWFVIAVLISVGYVWLVERSVLTYYDAGSAILYSMAWWALTITVIFPFAKVGIAGWRHGRWLWLESLAAWLVFGIVWGWLIS